MLKIHFFFIKEDGNQPDPDSRIELDRAQSLNVEEMEKKQSDSIQVQCTSCLIELIINCSNFFFEFRSGLFLMLVSLWKTPKLFH